MTPSVSISAGNSVGALLGGGAAHFSPDGKRLLVVNPAYGITVRELSSKGERSISVNLKSWKVVRWTHDSQAFLVLGVDEQNRSGVFRIDGVTGNPTLVAPVPYNTWSFTVSRDGKTIFHGTPRETQAFDTVAGTSRTLFTIAGGGNYDLRVSHDGSKLAIRGGVYLAVVNLQNRESHVIYKLPPNSAAALWAMDWTSDDTKIAVIARPGGGLEKIELWIFSPEGGEPSKQEIPREYRGLSFSPDGRLVATTSQTQRAQVWALENFLPVAK
jgi:WD40 repeat protein